MEKTSSGEIDVKLADFGFSTFIRDQSSTLENRIGTDKFMAPEILDCRIHDEKVDVWAATCLCYELLYDI